MVEKPPLDGNKHIQEYLDKGEGQSIEFKQRLNKPDKIAKTICSLANTDGGVLLIGIKDDKSIAKIDTGQEKYILKEALQFYCEPPVELSVSEVFVTSDDFPFEESSVLLLEIPESENKPHKARNKSNEWQVYIRHDDQTLMAGTKAKKQLEVEDVPIRKPKLNKNQQRLLAFLKKNSRITQKEYASLVNISDRRARRELMENLDLGLIRVLEHEKDDYFVL